MGDLKAAKSAAERANEWLTRRNLKRYKADRIYFYLLGEIHLANKEHEMAIDSHRKAVDLTPNPLYRNFYLHALGDAYYQAGRMDEAISTMEIVLRQNPSHADCLYTMAQVYQKKGDKKMAKEWLDKFKKVFKDADEGVEWVEKAKKMKV